MRGLLFANPVNNILFRASEMKVLRLTPGMNIS